MKIAVIFLTAAAFGLVLLLLLAAALIVG